MLNHQNSQAQYERAKHVIPGGVNSPARAFKGVGGAPIFFQQAKGATMTDADGHTYTDLVNSWGPMILGHRHPEVEKAVMEAVQRGTSFGAPTVGETAMAELVAEMVPSIEMLRMVNSGTEATMSALRVARGYTGKDKVIKFEGCYHGHVDAFLIAAGSGGATLGTPNSPGVTEGAAQDTLLAPYNDLAAVERLCQAHEDIGAMIVEPVPGNMGLIRPEPDFLEGLRRLCDQHGIVLIFDEVMTGFRVAKGGAQELFGVYPDLTALGKVIGGGLPVGAYGGKKAIMETVSPTGPVYQAGTLSGNPIAVAAGYTTLKLLHEEAAIYPRLFAKSEKIRAGLEAYAQKQGLPVSIEQMGSMQTLFFRAELPKNFEEAKASDLEAFKRFFHGMLEAGYYLPPSQFEAWFITDALSEQDVDQLVATAQDQLSQTFARVH